MQVQHFVPVSSCAGKICIIVGVSGWLRERIEVLKLKLKYFEGLVHYSTYFERNTSKSSQLLIKSKHLDTVSVDIYVIIV